MGGQAEEDRVTIWQVSHDDDGDDSDDYDDVVNDDHDDYVVSSSVEVLHQVH